VKNIVLVILLCFAAYKGWSYLHQEGVKPLYSTPYIAIYGRDSCGWTNEMIKKLKSSNISYEYHVVDEKDVADLLHARMEQSGISTRRYNLPVVDVNGKLSVRPESEEVIAEYKASL
jgi:glutaredoxin